LACRNVSLPACEYESNAVDDRGVGDRNLYTTPVYVGALRGQVTSLSFTARNENLDLPQYLTDAVDTRFAVGAFHRGIFALIVFASVRRTRIIIVAIVVVGAFHIAIRVVPIDYLVAVIVQSVVAGRARFTARRRPAIVRTCTGILGLSVAITVTAAWRYRHVLAVSVHARIGRTRLVVVTIAVRSALS
jgi:hypothetical protein